MDTEFPRGRGGPSRKIMEIPGDGGSTVKPPGTKNRGGWGSTWKKPSVGGMDIFWNHTLLIGGFFTRIILNHVTLG